MKPTLLIITLALASAAGGAFAAPMAGDHDGGSMAAPSQSDASQGASWVVQNEVEKARLERQGFPQYSN